jgi:hypothetical protein
LNKGALEASPKLVEAERYLCIASLWWRMPGRFEMDFGFKLFIVFNGFMVFNSEVGFDVDVLFEMR